MNNVQGLTKSHNQRFTVPLENNNGSVEFRLYYKSRSQSWFFDFTYNEITGTGLQVVLHPNILRQFKRQIPFGVAFSCLSEVEPFEDTVFSSGYCIMSVLNETDVQNVENYIYNNNNEY